eukprot:CAMPEP_0197847960 /NCGR_PEP_ID=MMETSP1438-20131217/7606_1 /TAXON_ID=1461541 /ORGANISM="Pterosperma sp., Strain CCMP1384" /LENGTH=515 /DNA_ID=CAMNT_0043460047 /DNA_START=296 /DNA_END=1841 /DNA_ORIENTATION=-
MYPGVSVPQFVPGPAAGAHNLAPGAGFQQPPSNTFNHYMQQGTYQQQYQQHSGYAQPNQVQYGGYSPFQASSFQPSWGAPPPRPPPQPPPPVEAPPQTPAAPTLGNGQVQMGSGHLSQTQNVTAPASSSVDSTATESEEQRSKAWAEYFAANPAEYSKYFPGQVFDPNTFGKSASSVQNSQSVAQTQPASQPTASNTSSQPVPQLFSQAPAAVLLPQPATDQSTQRSWSSVVGSTSQSSYSQAPPPASLYQAQPSRPQYGAHHMRNNTFSQAPGPLTSTQPGNSYGSYTNSQQTLFKQQLTLPNNKFSIPNNNAKLTVNVPAASRGAEAPAYLQVPNAPAAAALKPKIPGPPANPPAQDQAQGPKAWPPSLRSYVERAFKTCTDDLSRATVQVNLKHVISEAESKGELWSRDWDTAPLPGAPPKLAALARLDYSHAHYYSRNDEDRGGQDAGHGHHPAPVHARTHVLAHILAHVHGRAHGHALELLDLGPGITITKTIAGGLLHQLHLRAKVGRE